MQTLAQFVWLINTLEVLEHSGEAPASKLKDIEDYEEACLIRKVL